MHTDITPTTTVNINGKERLFFSGFSYLGLHAHPDFKEALKEGIDKYGTIFISSRIANVKLTLFDELEHTLKGNQEAALTFSSGYMAAQAASQYAGNQGMLLYAPNAHPSLQQHFNIPNLPWEDWARRTIRTINNIHQKYVIVADSVNPLTSTINDFSWLSQIHRDVLILIDDSHGIGITALNYPQQPNLDYLITASLAKAYSTQGGVITGRSAHIDEIKKQPIFTASTPMMPANIYAFLKSAHLHQTQKALLQQNIAYLKSITDLHNPYSLPIFLLKDDLPDDEVVISSFGYPHPDSPRINRIIVTAAHSTTQLDRLNELLKNNTAQ